MAKTAKGSQNGAAVSTMQAASVEAQDLFLVNTMRYSDVLGAWLKSVKIKTKESTYARYVHMVERHIRPQLGAYHLQEVTTRLIEGFIESKLRGGRIDGGGGLSSKTVTDMLTVIKGSVTYARCHHLAMPCNLSGIRIRKKNREIRVLSIAEQERLLRTLLQNMDIYKFGVLLTLYTGIRIGELCALQWEDVRLSDSTLKVRKTMQRIQNTAAGATAKTKIIVTEPKSRGSMREIPLPQCIFDLAKQFAGSPKNYVLSEGKKKFTEPRTMQNKFKAILRESQIDNVNFHCLRHTFATRCVETGFDVKSLSEILGHANVNITLGCYVHSSFELKRRNMDRLSLSI